jgi:uncharacterized protein
MPLLPSNISGHSVNRNALCLFYGPTPISKSPNEILPYSPVNIVGKIISEGDLLHQIKDSSKVVIKSE